jgi:riboflavin synthase
MTITEITNDVYRFFAMEETLLVTNFHEKRVGDVFNVELALRMGDFLDGHLVSGHIDTTGIVSGLVLKDDGSLILTLHCNKLESYYVIPK